MLDLLKDTIGEYNHKNYYYKCRKSLDEMLKFSIIANETIGFDEKIEFIDWLYEKLNLVRRNRKLQKVSYIPV